MDPNSALATLREMVKLSQSTAPDDYDRYTQLSVNDAVEQFAALDEWLSKGGFLPSDWTAES